MADHAAIDDLKELDKRLRACSDAGLSAYEAYDSFYQELVADALASPPVAVQEEGDAKDAARYRWLRDHMAFTQTVDDPVGRMKLSSAIIAKHDFHNDWKECLFEASVDATVDAAMKGDQP